MALIEEFLGEIDRLWTRQGTGKIEFNVIGSGALMLQTDYERRTKDGDVLEIRPIEKNVRQALMALAGRGSDLSARLRIYLDIVPGSLPFLPHPPLFHRVKALEKLRYFDVKVLDVVDVAVSKLQRFTANDRNDIREMITRDLISHARLVERFRIAMDRFEMDARAEDLPKYVQNLHSIEQTYFNAPTTHIDLPYWFPED